MRLRRREIYTASALVVLVLSVAAIYYRPREPQNLMAASSSFKSLPSPETGSSDAQYLNADGTAAEADGRVKDIRQTITGDLEKGTFEPVVLDIHDLVNFYDGYIYTEELTYTEETWSGVLVTRIPQNHTTGFVFDMRNLISENGEVTSITTSVRDITGEIGEGEPAPHASIKVALVEVLGKEPGPQPFYIPIISEALPVLTNVFTVIGVGAVIGVPTFIALLGVALLINRALLPIAARVFRRHKQQEAIA